MSDLHVLAIDPGHELSAYVLYHVGLAMPVQWGKVENEDMRWIVSRTRAEVLAMESVSSYGMAVGKEVFETCVWSGRLIERYLTDTTGRALRVYRPDVKLHLCNARNAKDKNVRQALIDRYGPGREVAIGRKASPGPLYGMAGDCWAALGVAVTASETALGVQARPVVEEVSASERSEAAPAGTEATGTAS